MRAYYKQANSLLWQLALLMLIFFLVEVSFFIQGLHFYFDDFNFIAHKIDIPYAILPGIAFFVFSQVLVHLGAVLLVWAAAVALAFTLKFSVKDSERLGLALWFLGLLTVCLSNQYYFPNSKFSYLSRFVVPDTLALVLLVFLYTFWASVLLLTSFVLLSALTLRKRLLALTLSFFILGF